jgi:hypothetical protein
VHHCAVLHETACSKSKPYKKARKRCEKEAKKEIRRRLKEHKKRFKKNPPWAKDKKAKAAFVKETCDKALKNFDCGGKCLYWSGKYTWQRDSDTGEAMGGGPQGVWLSWVVRDPASRKLLCGPTGSPLPWPGNSPKTCRLPARFKKADIKRLEVSVTSMATYSKKSRLTGWQIREESGGAFVAQNPDTGELRRWYDDGSPHSFGKHQFVDSDEKETAASSAAYLSEFYFWTKPAHPFRPTSSRLEPTASRRWVPTGPWRIYKRSGLVAEGEYEAVGEGRAAVRTGVWKEAAPGGATWSGSYSVLPSNVSVRTGDWKLTSPTGAVLEVVKYQPVESAKMALAAGQFEAFHPTGKPAARGELKIVRHAQTGSFVSLPVGEWQVYDEDGNLTYRDLIRRDSVAAGGKKLSVAAVDRTYATPTGVTITKAIRWLNKPCRSLTGLECVLGRSAQSHPLTDPVGERGVVGWIAHGEATELSAEGELLGRRRYAFGVPLGRAIARRADGRTIYAVSNFLQRYAHYSFSSQMKSDDFTTGYSEEHLSGLVAGWQPDSQNYAATLDATCQGGELAPRKNTNDQFCSKDDDCKAASSSGAAQRCFSNACVEMRSDGTRTDRPAKVCSSSGWKGARLAGSYERKRPPILTATKRAVFDASGELESVECVLGDIPDGEAPYGGWASSLGFVEELIWRSSDPAHVLEGKGKGVEGHRTKLDTGRSCFGAQLPDIPTMKRELKELGKGSGELSEDLRAVADASKRLAALKKKLASLPFPKEGRVIEFQGGDRGCYVIIEDALGKKNSAVLDDFELCEQESKMEALVNRSVTITYKLDEMPACPGCEETQQIVLVEAMDVVGQPK